MSTLYLYNHNQFEQEIENDTEVIAQEIINHEPTAQLTITDEFDNLVVSTIGNFIDTAPDKNWLERELKPILIPMQMGC